MAGGEGLRVYVRRLTLVLALALLVAGCSKASSPEPAKTSPPEATPPATAQVDALPQGEAPVPDEYRALYAELEEALNTFQDYLAAHWDGATGSTVFGAELLVANGNRGDVLLQPVTMDAVRLYLDRMQGLGIGGVSVEISYPLLRPDFPRSSDYLEFFREVAQEVHRRGLKLLVESGPVFPDPQYSQVQVDFSGLTVETYFQTRSEQLQLIAREVRPDYLAIGGEPATETMLTGLTFSLAEYMAFVEETADGIDRSSGILVGAGTGTWEDPQYLRAFIASPSLDFVNIHVYPLRSPAADYLMRAVEMSELARANGKKLVMGEAWLYKASPMEVGGSYQELFARDVYSFWEPLDSAFIEAIVGLGHYQRFEYVSLFWTNYFFSYLDYDATPRDLSRVELMNRANQAASRSILAGTLSATGQAFQQLLRGSPNTDN